MSKYTFKKPFNIGEEAIVTATIAPLTFSQFVELSKKVVNERAGKTKFEVRMQRARLVQQVTFETATGKGLKLTAESLMNLSASAAKEIVPKLDADEGIPGKILAPGDGINSAILYQFGTPIKAAGGTTIAEVEFLASTYAEIEEILAGNTELFQAFDLLQIAKPVGGTLMSMPSWAVDQVSLADGVFITNSILPSFLE